MNKIYPSLISCDILNLESQIKILEPHCSGFHLDIMDFNFVPNLTWGPDFINGIRKTTNKQLQIHLMVQNPEKYLNLLDLNPNDIVSIHIESKSELTIEETFKKIRDIELTPSIAISPYTPIEAILGLKTKLEHILLMSVNPGFSGQKFLEHVLDKLISLNNFRTAHNLNFKICLDGGINLDNFKNLLKNGADELAIAGAIFSSEDPVKTLKKFN